MYLDHIRYKVEVQFSSVQFERTAARISRTVNIRCSFAGPKLQTISDAHLVEWTHAFARRLICEQRAQLRAVRGE